MFRGRGVKNKTNYLHERSLRIVYKDNNSFFKDLLKKKNLFTVHHKTIHSLVIELFKSKENLSNTVINDILQTWTLEFVNASCFSLNSLYFAYKVWNIAASDIKYASNLQTFKYKIRK